MGSTSAMQWRWGDDGGDDVEMDENLSIFKYSGWAYGEVKMRVLYDDEYKAAKYMSY